MAPSHADGGFFLSIDAPSVKACDLPDMVPPPPKGGLA